MIQLVSKETYYKNNQELIQSPKYKFYYYSRISVEEKKEKILSEMYEMYGGTYYWRIDNKGWFATQVESYVGISFFIPEKFDFEIDEIFSNRIDHSNWKITKVSDIIPKDQTINKFHQGTIYFSYPKYDKFKDPLTSGVYSLNSSDGDVIEFSYLIEPHSWGDDSYIYTKEKETFPYDKEKVKLITIYIETVILWMRKQL